MRILLSVIAVLLFVPTYSTIAPGPRFHGHGAMAARPVWLDPADHTRRGVGRLTWLGGWQLDSHDAAFGGFSAMAVEGKRITLLSDAGNVVRFALAPGGRIRDARFSDLPDGPGTGWDKMDRDSESMTVDRESGRIWVGLEHYNAIWRFAPGFARAEAWVQPPAMHDWPVNGGPESLVRLTDGHFLVIAERDRPAGHPHGRTAILFAGDPTEDARAGFRFVYRPPDGYDPSDAAELPDGDILVLNRRFALPFYFSAELVIVPRASIRPGAVVSGRPVATLAAPLIHDNFEALAVTREGGATIVWIASDDNQSILQRSLLLKFRLEPETSGPKR